MNTLVKGALCLLLILSSVFCLQRFRSGYTKAEVARSGMSEPDAGHGGGGENAPEVVEPTSVLPVAETLIGTNGAPSDIAVATAKNTSPATPMSSQVPAQSQVGGQLGKGERKSGAFIWMGGFVASLLLLAGLLAWIIGQWMSNRTGGLIFAEDAPPDGDPEYEAAEAEWTNGNHLEAIGQMREYLKKNPREQFVAIRIAEIYEKDLRNPVAAVLELQEVLTQRLGREKWGWTAIHLANLYSGPLNQPDRAMALLGRIISEYPETSAAKKAKARLGITEAALETVDLPTEETQALENPPTDMPRGFTAKQK